MYLTASQAKPFFLQGQKHLQRALEFYKLDGHVSDYVAGLQARSL